MSGAVLEARAVIKGEDRTKAAFDSVIARMTAVVRKIEAMDKVFGSVGMVARNVNAVSAVDGRSVGEIDRFVAATRSASEALSQEVAAAQRLEGAIGGSTRAIERQAAAQLSASRAGRQMADVDAKIAREESRTAERRAEHIRRHGAMNYLAMGAAGYVGAHSVVSGIEEAVRAGANYQHEVVGLQNAGRTPEEIKHITDVSQSVVSKLPTASYLENLKVIAETTQAFGSVEHATDNLEFMQKAMSVLTTAGGDKIKGGPGEVGQALAKWYEERMRPAQDFQKNASAMIPAMVASGGLFNPEQLYAFAQQAKAAMPGYNDRFMSRIVPSLVAANGGERAGTALNAFDNVITGKARDKKQAAEWMRLGLLDPSAVVGGKSGPIGWKAGAVHGTNLASQDPLEWAESVLIPAMKAHGVNVDDRQSVKNELATLFRNQNANFAASELVQPQSRFRLHKDEGLFNQVGSIDDIYQRNVSTDPGTGLKAFQAALENLMSTLSGAKMGIISDGMTKLAGGIDVVANSLQNHPLLALASGATAAGVGLGASGYLSYKMMTGFGLNEAAGALTASAEALDVAAARLAGGGVAGGVLGGAAGAGSKLGLLASMGLPGLGAAAVGGAMIYLADPDKGIAHGGKPDHPWNDEDLGLPGVHMIEGRAEHPYPYAKDFTLGRFDMDFAADPQSSTAPGSISPMSRMLANKIGGAPFGISDNAMTVSLSPDSKATVDVTIKVDPSSDLLRAVETARSVTASGSLAAGAAGVSSPTKPYGGPAGIGRM